MQWELERRREWSEIIITIFLIQSSLRNVPSALSCVLRNAAEKGGYRIEQGQLRHLTKSMYGILAIIILIYNDSLIEKK